MRTKVLLYNQAKGIGISKLYISKNLKQILIRHKKTDQKKGFKILGIEAIK